MTYHLLHNQCDATDSSCSHSTIRIFRSSTEQLHNIPHRELILVLAHRHIRYQLLKNFEAYEKWLPLHGILRSFEQR